MWAISGNKKGMVAQWLHS